jgi:hypothetical protein
MKIAKAADGVDLLRRYQDAGCVQAAIDFSDAETFADFVKLAEAVVKTPL